MAPPFQCFLFFAAVAGSTVLAADTFPPNPSVVSAVQQQQQQTQQNPWNNPPLSIDCRQDIQRFCTDIEQIQSLETNLTTPAFLVKNRDSSYTKSWTNRDWDHHCARPLERYSRHIRYMWCTGSTIKTVLPAVALIVAWSILVSILYSTNEKVAAALQRAKLTTSLISTFGSPVALLLTLKTNRALDRVQDARMAWGQIKFSSQSLGGIFCAYILPTEHRKSALLAARYLSLMGWALKSWLREEDDEPVIRLVLPPEEAEWLLSTTETVNRPTAILGRLREICSFLAGSTEPNQINPMAHMHMEGRLNDMESSVGAISRILGSPIPPTYTRHTSRVLCLYLCFLPLALTGAGVSPSPLILAVALTSYVLIGIDELSLEMENPFPILPMQALSTAMQNNILQQVLMTRDMPILE